MQEVIPGRLQITPGKVTLILVAGGSSCVYNISKTRITLKCRLLLTLVITATAWVCESFFFFFCWVSQLGCASGCLHQRKAEEMSQRKLVNGRPSGTDGSDFSYRMVVDSRYKKAADGKSHLCKLIFIQGFIQFLAAVVVFLPTLEGATLDRLSVSSCVIFFMSLLIGELGRKRSRAILLKLYLFGSSVAAIITVVSVLQSEKSLEVMKDLSRWVTSKCAVAEIGVVSVGVVVQILALVVGTFLIHNMAPPKRAS